MFRFNPWRILRAIEDDPAQRRSSIIPCSILAMSVVIVLAVLLFPVIGWVHRLIQR